MPRNNYSSLIALGLSFVLCDATPAIGAEQSANAQSPVKTASFDHEAPKSAIQTVSFTKRPPRIGDEVDQTLSTEMRMTTTIRKGATTTQQDRTNAKNAQHRIVTTTAVDAGRAAAVRVKYVSASKQISVVGGEQAAPAASDVAPTPQPVSEKTYLCRREPGEDGKLIVTYENGDAPPSEECEIVVEHMDIVGRGNPLADFLAGKTIKVGDALEVPRDVAGKIFNLGDQFGEVQSFKLTLLKVETENGRRRAVFLAQVDAALNNASQMRMEMEGALAVEADTCRTVKVDLTGPIAMSETRGSYSTSFQVIGTGQLKSRLASTFRDAKR